MRAPQSEMRNSVKGRPNGDGDEPVSDEEDWDTEYPELMFVPIKLTEPTVPAVQFFIYLIMLFMFMYVISSQHLEDDFKANVGLQQGVRLKTYNKISSIEDYNDWWSQLMLGFDSWTHPDYTKAHVIMVGMPDIKQYRGRVDLATRTYNSR